MSQFSAAIADTLGAGGVVETESRQRVEARRVYPVIVGAAVALVWMTDVFEIVALASRAFAFYYLLQVLMAIMLVQTTRQGTPRWAMTASYSVLAAVLTGVVLFALPVE